MDFLRVLCNAERIVCPQYICLAFSSIQPSLNSSYLCLSFFTSQATMTAAATTSVARAAYAVDEFCEAHRITKVFFYQQINAGTGPRIMKVGRRTLISVEAAADWRREREQGAALLSPRGKGA